ncbi:MAG: T9SS type A sorting domain-containing protein [Flavobacterium sp.]|nr:T9SS type A sorting domain-containing protein [Flavobacterium sp.]
MKKTLLFLFTLLLLENAHAQNIFKDDFSTYTINQELSGQGLWSNSPILPNVGIGACLPLSANEPCFGTKVIGQSVSYPSYGSSESSILLGPVQDGVARAITPIVSGGDLYLGLVLNITSAPTTAGLPVDFLRVINSDATQVTYRLLVKDAGFGYNVGIRKGASSNATVYTGDIFNYGENVLVILKYSHLDGPNDDIVSAFINPIYGDGEPANPNITNASGFDQSGAIDRVAFRMNYNVTASMPTGVLGLVSTSTTWEGLSFLPLGVNQFEANNVTISSVLENGQLQISSKKTLNNVHMKLYSATGALLEEKMINIPTGTSQIGLASKLSSGLYIIQLYDESGEKSSFKMISK